MQDIKTDGKVIMLPPKKSVNFSSLKQEKEFDPDESIGVSADLRELSATSLPGKSILKASSKAAPLRVHFSKLSLDKECELDPDDTPLTKQEWKFDPDDSLPLIRKINLNLEPIRSNIKVCPKTPKDYTTEMEDLVPMRRDRTHNLKYYLPCSRLLLKWHSLIHLEQDGTIPTLKDTVLQIEKEEKEEKEELKGKEEEELRKESNPASSLGVSSSSSDSTNLEGASGYSDITDLEGA
ncbi:hypothetical protein, partial [Candidatus Ichthyocystis hellenicum]|uniref:hypothetical protein n=1 Tax=Candidatus Ichthyocystis hellenicum TaxID=1561003 RepID=UPI001585C014